MVSQAQIAVHLHLPRENNLFEAPSGFARRDSACLHHLGAFARHPHVADIVVPSTWLALALLSCGVEKTEARTLPQSAAGAVGRSFRVGGSMFKTLETNWLSVPPR